MRTFFLVGAWLVLPIFLGQIVSRLYHAWSGWLDRKHPDTLPIHAGGWVRQEIAKRNVPVCAVPTLQMEGMNRYVPRARLIVLAQRAFYKPDPGAWGTAAHELGHAIFHTSRPTLGVLFLWARGVPKILSQLAVVLVGTNYFYGSALVNRLALGLLVAAALLSPMVIFEEAMASRDGLRMLKEDGRLDARGLRAARLDLSAALITYINDWLGQLLAIALFGQVRAIVEVRHFVAAGPLTGVRLVVAAAATVLIAVRVGYMAVRKKSRVHGLWDLPVVALLAVVWNQPGLMASALLAVLSSARILMFTLLPLVALATFLAALVTPRARWEISPILMQNVASSQREIEDAQALLTETGRQRMLSALELAYSLACIPLVVQFWLWR